jgi:hypothetical protein
MKALVRRFSVAVVVALSFFASVARADLVVTRKACNWLVSHQTDADAIYQPGVDVHGRAVAPADVSGSDIVLPETIVISIKVLIQDRYGIPENSPLWDAEAEVGLVEITGDQVYFNGTLLEGSDQVALARLCRDRGFRR